MNTENFVAKRYLFSKKSVSLISTLTWVSITGVTIGTALLIIVLSVFNGFYDLIQQLLLSNDPHIRVVSAEKRYFNPDTFEIPPELNEQILFVEYFVEGNCIITRAGRKEFVTSVKGISQNESNSIYPITSGQLNLAVSNKIPGVVVSELLAQELRLYVDDPITLLSADGIRRSLTQFSGPRMMTFQINGLFSLQDIINKPLALIDLRAAQRLFYLNNEVSGIDIRLHDSEQAFAVKAALEKRLGPTFKISTWYDLQKPLYDIMRLEKWASYAILMIIVLVAILNIIGSLTMIVIQKKKDIGILMAMGMSKKQIISVFRKQGLLIGVIGCGIGGGIGLAVSLIQEKFGIVKLAGAESFIIDAYPISVAFGDVAFVIATCLLLCLGASWFPSKRASEISVIDALRYE